MRNGTTKPLYGVRRGKMHLNLHPGQQKAWDSTKKRIFVFGGTQGGKTAFAPLWLWREIQMCGAGTYLAVTASFDLLKLKMLRELLKLFVETLHIGRFYKSTRILEICNPAGEFVADPGKDEMYARIILRSAQAGSKSGKEGASGLESATANAAWLDEAGLPTFTLQAYDAVKRRLLLSEGRILCTTSLYGFSWLKTEVYDRWKRGDQNIDVISFKSIENPVFPRKSWIEAKQTLPLWKFDLLYCGIFTRPAGLIYGDFNAAIHVVEDFSIPESWNRYVGVDFGGLHTALVWIAEDEASRTYYIYRESLEGNKTTFTHVKEALAHEDALNVSKWVGGAVSEEQWRRDWQQAGIQVEKPPISAVEPGIDRIVTLLKNTQDSYKLKVFGSCIGIIEEFGDYSRKVDDQGNVTEEIKAKAAYHRLDALRYAISGVYNCIVEEETHHIANYFVPVFSNRNGIGNLWEQDTRLE